MTSVLESLFSSSKVDPKLEGLFSSASKFKKTALSETATDQEPAAATEAVVTTKKGKKVRAKLDPAETEKRTIFIGNLSSECKKEDLTKIFKQYGKIESIRFRNIVPEDMTKSKKYAFITKQQNKHQKTITAFVRFEDADAATRAAEEVNGMEFKSLHLRVDLANKGKSHDNKLSLFLGGLPFDVSDEAVYKHFASCGDIDYVRIVRDNKTGVGKGFGYVKFKTSDSLSLAIKLDGSRLNSRTIRVNRCAKKMKNKDKNKNKSGGGSGEKPEAKKPFKPRDTRRRESTAKPKGGAKRAPGSKGKKPAGGGGAKKRPEISTNKKDKKRLRI